MEVLPDRKRTGMIIPVSKETFFNTKWKPKEAPLCAYDMLYHPPDYNPKAARSDQTESKIIRKNIWDQEFHKGISSTNHFMYGRPKWKPIDIPTKQFVRITTKNQRGDMQITSVLEWATLVEEGKPNICEQ